MEKISEIADLHNMKAGILTNHVSFFVVVDSGLAEMCVYSRFKIN